MTRPWLMALVVMAALARAQEANAEAPAAISVVAEGSCPGAAQFASALSSLLAGSKVAVAPAPGMTLRIVDQGPKYRVEMGSLHRGFVDSERRCGERARTAAVAVALVLDPPAILAEPPPPSRPMTRHVRSPHTATTPAATATEPHPPIPGSTASPGATQSTATVAKIPVELPTSPEPPLGSVPVPSPPPKAPPVSAALPPAPPTTAQPESPEPPMLATAPAPLTPVELPSKIAAPPPVTPGPTATANAPRRPRFFESLHVDLEPFAQGTIAPDQGAALAGGGGLRLAVGGRYLALAVGTVGITGLSVAGLGGSASVDRIASDLSLRAGFSRGRFELAGEAGLLLTALLAHGQGFATNASDAGLDVGVRVALQARVRVHPRVAPFLALVAEVSPESHPVVVAEVSPDSLPVVPSDGKVGTTPRFWLGLSLGLSIRLR